MDSIQKNIGKTYAQSILGRGEKVLTEGFLNDLIDETVAIIDKKGVEVPKSRVELARALFDEIGKEKVALQKLMGSYLTLLADPKFLEKALAIGNKVWSEVKLDNSQKEDIDKLTEYVRQLSQDAGNKNAREKAKLYLGKVLAFITDEDLRKIVAAESALVKLVGQFA